MAIYMQYDDNSIGGDVTDANFTGWIELSSFQWGIGRPITPPSTGSEADRESSIPSVSEIVVTKTQDSASGGLMRAACGASPVNAGKLVHLAFVRTGSGGGSEAYITYDLENCLVSGFSQSSGGERPTESVTLNFTKITFNYTNSGPTTANQGPDHPFYDLAQQKGG